MSQSDAALSPADAAVVEQVIDALGDIIVTKRVYRQTVSDTLYPLVALVVAARAETARANEWGRDQREMSATHRCRICGALWILSDRAWSLASKKCGPCCDNVPMGVQIEPIGLMAKYVDACNEVGKLTAFARHKPGCQYDHNPGSPYSYCSCGLDALREELRRTQATLAARTRERDDYREALGLETGKIQAIRERMERLVSVFNRYEAPCDVRCTDAVHCDDCTHRNNPVEWILAQEAHITTLRRYARHHLGCDFSPGGASLAAPCTCGLEAALRAVGGGQ